MPEAYLTVRWPDGTQEACYSPSSTIAEHFEPGRAYPLDDFLVRMRAALAQASARVQARYGHPCGAAAAELARVERRAAAFAAAAPVACLALSAQPPRPATQSRSRL